MMSLSQFWIGKGGLIGTDHLVARIARSREKDDFFSQDVEYFITVH